MSGESDYLILSDHNAQCARCGMKKKASTLKKLWYGPYVCPEHWEPRQPQDFVRAITEHPSPPWSQPDNWTPLGDALDPWTAQGWFCGGLTQYVSTATKCLQVRRSSDNAVQDIGFVGGVCDFASIAAFCTTNSGFVSLLYNQFRVTTPASLSQATLANQPLIYNAGTFLNTLRFNGTTSAMASSSNFPAYSAATVFLRGTFYILNATQTVYELGPNFNATPGFVFSIDTDSLFHVGISNASATSLNNYSQGQTSGTFVQKHDISNVTPPLQNEEWFKSTQQAPAAMGAKLTGNFTANPLNVGARNGASFFTQMDLYSLVVYIPGFLDQNIPEVASLI